MDAALRKAIEELLDAADYALKPLDRYSDYEDSPFDLRPEPNDAMVAYNALTEAIEAVDAAMPKKEAA